MSTVLTNGVIIPENGSRNWGGDLANNWNILDVNVGYMTDVKNRVTTLENSVTENTANIQINASNISALQTSKQDSLSDQQIANIADVTNKANDSDVVHKSGDEIINGTKTFTSQIKGTIDKSKDYYLSDNTLASANGSLGTVKYYYHSTTADLDTEIFEHSLWDASAVTNSIPTALDLYYYIDQYFYLSRTATSNRIQILRGYRNANLHMVRVYNSKTNSWSEWAKFASDSDVVHKTGNEIISGVKNFNDVVLGEVSGQIRIGNNGEGALFCNLAYDGRIYNNSYQFVPATSNEYNLGSPSNKWKDIYATNAAINTSDRNAKTDIKIIDDNILEAWDKVSLVSFKFKDAVEKKGDIARIHTGYIAQNIKEELNKHGIDACKYGLFCYNAWNAQEEKSHEKKRTNEKGDVEIVKVIDTPAVEAGETYGLRYIECLVVECAYLRKKNKELENRITKLEENLTKNYI